MSCQHSFSGLERDLGPIDDPGMFSNIQFTLYESNSQYRDFILLLTYKELHTQNRKNPVRILAYNIAISDFFNNEYFIGILETISDYSNILYHANTQKTIYELIETAVREVCTIAASILVFRYTELRSILDSRAVDAASSGLRRYNEIVQQITNFLSGNYIPKLNTGMQNKGAEMYNRQNNPQYIPMVDPRTGQTVMVDSRQVQMPNQQMYNPQMNQMYGQRQPMYGQQNSIQQWNNVTNSGYSDSNLAPPIGDQSQSFGSNKSYKSSYSSQEPMQVDTGEVFISFTYRDWRPSDLQSYLSLIDVNAYSRCFVKEYETIVEKIEPLPENLVMDRDKHSLVAKNYDKQELTSNIEAMASVTYENIIKSNCDENLDPILEEVNCILLLCNSLEEMISLVKVKHYSKDNKKTIYRAYGIYSEVIPGVFDITDYTEEVFNFQNLIKTFGTLDNFREIRNYMTSVKTETDETADNYLLYIDRVLTKVVNDYLSFNMSLPLTIDSFYNDVLDIPDYLSRSYSNLYRDKFIEFEQLVSGKMFNSGDLDIIDSAREFYSQDGNDGKKCLVFAFSSCSVTSIDMLSIDLINVEKELISDKALLISSSKHRNLYSIAVSLFKQSHAFSNLYFSHYLVTLDNEIYRLFKGAIGLDSYLITKVK